MAPLNLKHEKFSNKSDKVQSDRGIVNPARSDVRTLKGADEIIGNYYIDSDFGFGAFLDVAADNLGGKASAALNSKATIRANGIKNKGSISTDKGRDLIQGNAKAEIAAVAQTVSQAIAYAGNSDTVAIANTFAKVNIKAVANGINNSGEISTGKGSDTIDGDITASVAAVATATADATAIVQAIAQAPVDDTLTAFAGAIAQSLAKATVVATGIKNVRGKITTDKGGDHISATANSYSATYAEASAYAFTAATPGNQALALTVAKAIAQTEDKAFAIKNTRGYINLGKGGDSITANANATDKAIAIKNNQGIIHTGNGDDTIKAHATGNESYGIFGGTIDMGNGSDRVEASSFGGGVNIDMGNGKDFVEGFGKARIDGGRGFDTLSLGDYNIDDFNISFGANNNKVIFERNDVIMTTTQFEQFKFDNGKVNLTYEELVA